jgi:hypothetical protein
VKENWDGRLLFSSLATVVLRPPPVPNKYLPIDKNRHRRLGIVEKSVHLATAKGVHRSAPFHGTINGTGNLVCGCRTAGHEWCAVRVIFSFERPPASGGSVSHISACVSFYHIFIVLNFCSFNKDSLQLF